MDRVEFTKAMLYLSAGVQRMLKPEEVEVYFDMLGDLPFDKFLAGVKSVLVAHVWNTFPSVAELRQAATAMMRGKSGGMTPAEIWEKALEATKKLDLDIRGPYRVRIDGEWQEFPSQAAFVLKDVPGPVRRAMEAFGLRELVYATDPMGVVRGQFLRIAEQLSEATKREELLPPSVREQIAKQFSALEGKRDDALIQKALGSIGELPK